MSSAKYSGFINTFAIWDKDYLGIPQFHFPLLNLDTFTLAAIPNNIRLGHQIEYVFKQLIDHSEDFEVLIHNLPIRKEKSTLGEIDFILKNNLNNKLIHVELAYKFYIIDPKIDNPIDRLIGPNRRDRFVDKMQKIKDKQIPLLHTEEGSKALYDYGIDHKAIEHQCCFKAQLFHPYGIPSIDIGPLSRDCTTGYWLRMEDFNNPEFQDAEYYIPSKSEWVIAPNAQTTWKAHADIIMDITQSLDIKRSPMIWRRLSEGQYEKLFVVWW